MPLYRILCLDGGGAWALIQAKALIDIYGERAEGLAVLSEFDLVAANSGGSITLGGLLENLRLSELLNYFKDDAKRRSIFKPTNLGRAPANLILHKLTGVGAQYDAGAKLQGLRVLMPNAGARRMSELPSYVTGTPMQSGRNCARSPQFLICGFDYDRLRETFFRSHTATLASSRAPSLDPTLAEAIHASTNAPVNYFDAPAELVGHRYWDGAIGGYNNPVVAALVEAMADGTPMEQIRVLSIGTGSVFLPLADASAGASPVLTQAREASTILQDLKLLATAIVDDPPDAATFVAYVMLGQRLPKEKDDMPVSGGAIVRMNPLIQPVRASATDLWRVPAGLSEAQFDRLRRLDMDAVAAADVELIELLCDCWLHPPVTSETDSFAVRNQPIRANSTTLQCEIGHWTYAEAKAAWLGFRPTPAELSALAPTT